MASFLSLSLVFFFSSLVFSVAAQGAWLQKTPMPTPRSDISAITLPNDIIAVAGGCNGIQFCPPASPFCSCNSITNEMLGYKPLTDQWITLASMPIPRFRHRAALLGNQMYVFGGRDINDNPIQQIDVYNYATDSWRTSLTTWSSVASDGVIALVGSKIYLIGGYTPDYNSLNSTWIFDTVSETLALGNPTVSPLIISRGDACAVTVGTTIYVVGGYNSDNFCAPLNSLEILDLTTGVWTEGPPLHFARGSLSCGVQHGDFHAIGGEKKENLTNCNRYNVPVKIVERYQEGNNTWYEETSVPSNRFRFAAASFGNSFYIFGGQGSLNASNVNDTYFPLFADVEVWEDTTGVPIGIGNMIQLCAALLLATLSVSMMNW